MTQHHTVYFEDIPDDPGERAELFEKLARAANAPIPEKPPVAEVHPWFQHWVEAQRGSE